MATETEKNLLMAHTAIHLLFRISRSKCTCTSDVVKCPACLAADWFEKYYFNLDLGDSE